MVTSVVIVGAGVIDPVNYCYVATHCLLNVHTCGDDAALFFAYSGGRVLVIDPAKVAILLQLQYLYL